MKQDMASTQEVISSFICPRDLADAITGDVIMDYALVVIGQSSELVGGRIVLIECKPIESLINFYIRNGFEKCDKYFDHILVHTGQNWDYTLNQIFFEDLGLWAPDYYLEAVGDDLGETIGNIIA